MFLTSSILYGLGHLSSDLGGVHMGDETRRNKAFRLRQTDPLPKTEKGITVSRPIIVDNRIREPSVAPRQQESSKSPSTAPQESSQSPSMSPQGTQNTTTTDTTTDTIEAKSTFTPQYLPRTPSDIPSRSNIENFRATRVNDIVVPKIQIRDRNPISNVRMVQASVASARHESSKYNTVYTGVPEEKDYDFSDRILEMELGRYGYSSRVNLM